MEDKKFLVTIAFLVIVLAVNLFTWQNTKELEQKVTLMQNELNNLQSRVTHEVASIRGTVQRTVEEERWWTPAGIDYIEKTGSQEVEVKISWQLREYQEGSKVIFNYRPGDKEEYKEIAANQETGGRFFVVLPVKVPKEPSIDIQVNSTQATHNERSVVAEKPAVLRDNQMRYQYYISLQEGNTVRTGETRTLDLSKLSFELFNPLELTINQKNNNEFSAVLNEYIRTDTTEYKIKNARIESRTAAGQVLEKWSLTPLENERANTEHNNIYNTGGIVPEKTHDSMYIVINYTGGLTVEKEILKHK